ncbi:MAG: 50S ribosomal protein L4 [Chloroflexota bacterium]
MQLQVMNRAGEQVGTIEVDDAVFGIKPNLAVLHQVVVAHQANRRAGTHSTKTRGEVEGSTRKIRPQKGTGRSRQGGVVFGPKPRKYTQRIPKMLRRLAIRSALSAKVADNELVVLDELTLERPKTKEMLTILQALGATRSPLIVTEAPNRTVFLAARNIPGAKVLPATHINTEEILKHHRVVMTVGAVRKAEALWGGERARKRLAPIPVEV